MKSLKNLLVLALVLNLCLALCACNNRSTPVNMFGQSLGSDFREENSFHQSGDTDIQLQPVAPTEKYQYVIGPDGSVSTIIIGGADGGDSISTIIIGGADRGDSIHVDIPDASVETLPVEKEETSYADIAGVWQSLRYDAVYDGHAGGSAVTWYLCENGYALYETSDGEIDVNRGVYYLNYLWERLYGRYTIENGVFTFTVEEDWMYASSPSIGQTRSFPIYTGNDGFFMVEGDTPWQYTQIKDYEGLLDVIREANGGPTGNDQYDPNWVDPVISQKPQEGQVGKWVAFTDQGNGRILREIWQFESDSSCYKEADTLYLGGDGWLTEGYGESVGGIYYFVNGQMHVEVGPDVYGIYDLTINGDTMTMHYIHWDGREITTTFTRFEGLDKPVPTP